MVIIKATESNGASRRDKCGVTIQFTCDEDIRVGDTMSLNYGDKTRYFEVTSVEIEHGYDDMVCTAVNVGYYNKLKRINIREFILKSFGLSKVTDENEIRTLEKEKSYI